MLSCLSSSGVTNGVCPWFIFSRTLLQTFRASVLSQNCNLPGRAGIEVWLMYSFPFTVTLYPKPVPTAYTVPCRFGLDALLQPVKNKVVTSKGMKYNLNETLVIIIFSIHRFKLPHVVVVAVAVFTQCNESL